MKRKQVAFSMAETRHILFMDRDYYKIGKNKNEKKMDEKQDERLGGLSNCLAKNDLTCCAFQPNACLPI
jgi:hypothetical protein